MYNALKPFLYAAAFCMLLFFFPQQKLYMQKSVQENKTENEVVLPPFFNSAVQKELCYITSVHVYDLNPHTANHSAEAQILNGLYEGLFSYDPLTLEPLPAVAETFRISRDQKTWTFTLRTDVYFSNGEPIEAEDVRRSWLTLLTPEIKAPFASLFDCIKGAAAYRNGNGTADGVGITVKNKKTLVVHLNKPANHFSKILCHHAFAVVHPDKKVYTGAFILKEYNEKELVLEKNPLYYNASDVALPVIRIVNSNDKNENTFAFNTGLCQWVSGSIDAGKIYNKNDVLIYPQFATEFFFFKASGKPWDDPLMRKAVISAIPWEKLRSGNPVSAKTLVFPLQDYPAIYGIDEYDTEEARQMLSHTLDNRREANKRTEAPILKLAVPDYKYVTEQAELITLSLENIGIKTVVQILPADRYLESFADGKADMYTYTWVGDFADPLAFLELFRSDSTLRETDWKDSRFDTLLEQASSITDNKERYKKLAEAEQFLLDENIVLPISHPVSLNVVDTGTMGGWFANALDIHPFKYLFFAEPPETDGFI